MMITDSWYLLNSKYNCENNYRLNPDILPQQRHLLSPKELEEKTKVYANLIRLTDFFVRKLLFFLKDIPAVVIITDDECNVLKVMGNEDMRKNIEIKEGVSFQEQYTGTNSIHLCLNHNQPIQVKGKEHYHKALYNYCCSSCKFTLEEGISGTITLMTKVEQSSAFHLGLVSSVTDAIEREIELNKKNKKLNLFNQVILNSTKNGIIIIDHNGIITDFNEAAENYTGCTKNDVIGNHIYLFKDAFNKFFHYIENVLTDNTKYENIELHFHIDKSNKVCLFDALPIYDDDQFIGVFCQFRDITDRYELEQQVIANEKLSIIGQLSAGLAHEIRNPLTPISGFLQLLEKNCNCENANLYFKIINEELERVKELINNFVLVSKPEAPCKSKVHIQTLLSETIQFMKSEAILHNVSIFFTDHNEEEIFINIDKNQIKQVLINLLQNAIEEMSGGGEIHVTLMKNNETKQIEISVIDQGSGVDEEVLANIFKPFVTTKQSGTGLGLSVCHRIIKNHHGEITVETKKNEGSIFTIKLPFSVQEDN
ncbi:ATP-binding protein [Calidifontibacillus erzurumensis]|uniref:ATP-binding protein n=1 Tax=Calidifontibacillus erzurumensis TaxID=2741433 RepID=UPI0035B4FBB0